MGMCKVFLKKKKNHEKIPEPILSFSSEHETLERLYAMAYNKLHELHQEDKAYISKIQIGRSSYPYYESDEKEFRHLPKEFYSGIEVVF